MFCFIKHYIMRLCCSFKFKVDPLKMVVLPWTWSYKISRLKQKTSKGFPLFHDSYLLPRAAVIFTGFMSWALFLSLARSKLRLCLANHRVGYFSNLACDWLSIDWAYSEWNKLRLCSTNHRAGYFNNLACDWLSIDWAYSEPETENGPWFESP